MNISTKEGPVYAQEAPLKDLPPPPTTVTNHDTPDVVAYKEYT